MEKLSESEEIVMQSIWESSAPVSLSEIIRWCQAVSYTHLDVYKRQAETKDASAASVSKQRRQLCVFFHAFQDFLNILH